jgi:diguanylate cyclase (GGDEF)-like protein
VQGYHDGVGWAQVGWAAVKRAQMWPGIATPTLWARTAGACFLFGGMLVGLIAVLALSDSHGVALHYANASVAVVIGICVLLIGPRVTQWQFHLLVAAAILQITVSVTASTGVVAVSFATLYAFIGCAAFFVAWPPAVMYLVFAITCCMAALSVAAGVPWWTGVITAATTAAIGTIVMILGRVVARAELDVVTGVPNRRGFDRAIGAEINRAHSADEGPAVVFICVDGYAAIHEEFGDRAADAVMQQLVASWQSMLQSGQVVARRGDDGFALMLPASTEEEAFALAERLRAVSSREFSAGVSAWDVGESASPVYDRADVALRRAKSIGRNRTMLESSHLPALAVQLSDALAAETIDVSYQPIVRLNEDDGLIGVEALLRWTPAFGPRLGASEVIRVAEDNDLISRLDQYVLRRACLDAVWMQRQLPDIRLSLSVNVSGLELFQQGYVARVVDTLASTGWPAEQLILEVTESVLDVDRPSSISALHDLRALGIRIAVDDFGTGYSSLSRLQKMPTDLLKLDRSFTASITSTSSFAPPLLQAVVGLADALALPIVAEGVETAHQASVLRHLGFPLGQGFHFGRPQSREDVIGMAARATR